MKNLKKNKKHKVFIMTLLFAFVLTFVSCNTANSTISYDSQSTNNITDNIETVTDLINSTQINYNVYEQTGDNPYFSVVMNNNPIDKDYYSELNEANSTYEFVNIEKNFLIHWKKEWSESVNNFCEILSKNDAEKFLELQNAWEKQISENLKFEAKILQSDEYEISLGSSFNYLKISQEREAYRQQAIRVKYICYLFETATMNSIPQNELLSLNFAYNK